MSATAASRAGTPWFARRLSWRMRPRWPFREPASRGAVSRRGLSACPKHPLSDLEQRPGTAPCPSVREREGRDLGHRSHELLDLGHPYRLALRPRRDLGDLVREAVEVVLADVLDQERTGIGLGLDPGLPEALGDPADAASLGHVVEQEIACLRARLGERAVLLHFEPYESEHGVRSGRGEVGGNHFDLVSPPAACRRPVLLLLAPVDVVHEHESCVAEEAARVAERDDVGRARLECRDDLDRLGDEMRPEDAGSPSRPSAGRCPRSGRPASGRGARSSVYGSRRSVRTVKVRPSDSSTMRPSSSVLYTRSPKRAWSATSVSARGWP